MRKTLLVPIAAALWTTGCRFDLVGPIDWSGLEAGCCAPGIFSTPSATHLLSGDTIQLFTFAFPASGTDSTSWTVAGDSSFRVFRISAAPRDTAVLVAAQRGSARVTVSRGITTASVVLTSHDSADVNAVRVWLPGRGTTIRQSQPEYGTAAELLVGNQPVAGRPTWSSSDTTRATIEMRAGSPFDPAPRAVIVPRSAGVVYIIAAWRTVRDSVSLTITP